MAAHARQPDPFQQQRQRGWKLYSFHAPEVECIGKGKASAPFGSASRPRSPPPMPARQAASSCCTPNAAGQPYDGHTLGVVIEDTERLTGCEVERAYVDKGYRGHRAANPRRVLISGQKRGVFGVIKRELRRRCAIEAVIGHHEDRRSPRRCHLKGREGDAANVILTAVGHNLRLVLAWLRALCRLIVLALLRAFAPRQHSDRLLNGRLDIAVTYPWIRHIKGLLIRLQRSAGAVTPQLQRWRGRHGAARPAERIRRFLRGPHASAARPDIEVLAYFCKRKLKAFAGCAS